MVILYYDGKLLYCTRRADDGRRTASVTSLNINLVLNFKSLEHIYFLPFRKFRKLGGKNINSVNSYSEKFKTIVDHISIFVKIYFLVGVNSNSYNLWKISPCSPRDTNRKRPEGFSDVDSRNSASAKRSQVASLLAHFCYQNNNNNKGE